MKKAIIYRRASTNETTQSTSLGNQEAELKEFVTANGYEIIADIAEYQSAFKSKTREGFDKALSILSHDKDAVLVVNDLTRLSRDIGNWSSWSRFLPRIRFANLGDKAITELEASLYLVIAANESRVLSERIKKGIQRAKERAAESGTTWKSGGNPNPVKASRVLRSQTFSWRETISSVCSTIDPDNTLSLQKKCDWLNANGFKNQRGRTISKATLRNALVA